MKTLRDEIGDDDFPEVVEIFIEEVSEMIEQSASAPQIETLGEDFTLSKGVHLNLGFTGFSQLCQVGETAAANGQAEEIDLPPILAAMTKTAAHYSWRV